MSLFDSAYATAKNLAKGLGNGGIPAVHCGGKIRGEDFEATCTRSRIPAGIEPFREYQLAILQRLHGIGPSAYQHAKKLILNWN